ncbi:MAG: zinc ribbon domain-containing protein [Oscillospiraceae bacterium]|nr:zinc ribbon domain-containing protein [Oscillospiraceae bacterium]
MFCEKCGKEVESGSRFCQNCGATVAVETVPAAASTGVPIGQKVAALLKDKKKAPIVYGVGAAILAAIVLIIVLVSLPRTVVLDDYITIQYDGLSTVGTAELELDEEGLMKDLGKDLTMKELNTLYAALMKADFKLELDTTENLSNGDNIHITFSYNEEALKQYDVRIKLKKDTRTVEGLQEPVFLDVFEKLELTYEGCAPYTKVTVTDTSGNPFIQDYVTYRVENGTKLSEGSEFTVHASYSDYDANEKGYIVKESSKKYIAVNLPQPKELDVLSYITVDFSGIEGRGVAKYTLDSELSFLSRLRFTFNKSSSLKEGDVITLSYTNPYNMDPLEYGYTFTGATAKQITVPKLGAYVTDFSQIPEAEGTKLLKWVEERARYYLTAEKSKNGMESMKLTGTDYSSGNELSHAEATGNVKLHSVVAGKRYSTQYLVFVYTFDITKHPNVTENGGNVTNACIYLYLTKPVLKGDGTLDVDYTDHGDLYCKTTCYLTYEALESEYLKTLTEQVVYTAQ